MVALDPRRAGEHRAAAVRLEDVDHRERQIERIGGKRPRAALAGLLPAAGLGSGGGELAQQGELPLADHALSVVGIGAEDAADRAVVVRYRAVGEGVVGLFRIAVALHDEELGLDVGALLAAHGLREHRADLGPEFAPYDGGGLAERPGMPAADDGLVGVVVEVGSCGPQPIQIGWREVSMMPTAVFKLFGQVSGAPMGVAAQSNARINCASSLLPTNGRSRSPDRFARFSTADLRGRTLMPIPFPRDSRTNPAAPLPRGVQNVGKRPAVPEVPSRRAASVVYTTQRGTRAGG